ncbi:hypothetical protein EEB11_02685 [Pseudotabrizicola sediminis]|uniref:Uncharacterized protein n=1 Tax=Pseudotabrizicola sediminis TaxID=2486418 RepID=A0ABY2KPA6_9RHOB|nr:hypothetical protein EEB11_02685 [Pseudotabrizicola sediminis]
MPPPPAAGRAAWAVPAHGRAESRPAAPDAARPATGQRHGGRALRPHARGLCADQRGRRGQGQAAS